MIVCKPKLMVDSAAAGYFELVKDARKSRENRFGSIRAVYWVGFVPGQDWFALSA